MQNFPCKKKKDINPLTISFWVAKPNLIPTICPSKIVDDVFSSISFYNKLLRKTAPKTPN